jgi:serine/threonine protein kinase
VRHTVYGELFQATDTSTGSPVSIQLLRHELTADPGQMQALQEAAGKATMVDHKNVARVLDMATEGEHVYLVSEFLDGHTLQELLDRKRAEGATFSPKQVSNITAHLCAAVSACSEVEGHGAVILESVMVNKAGRVKLGSLGLGTLAPALTSQLGARLSPEAQSGAGPSSPADVYGVGALVYELLVGTPPQKGCKRPSEAVPGLSNLVDQFVGATTNPDPGKRPTVQQLAPAVKKALSTPSGEQPRQSQPQAVSKPARPSLAQAITTPQADPSTPAPAANQSAALTRALEDTHARWLHSKGKLDYGPYSMSELVQQIKTNKIMPGETLVDNETGSRVKAEDHPLLGDLMDAAKQKRDDERRANAEVVHAKQERSRGATLYIIVAVAVLGLGGGAYKLVKTLSADDTDDKSKVAGLAEGSMEATISFPSKAQAKKRRNKNRKGKKGDKGTAGGWDDSLDFDMAGAGGGSETLSNSQVNPVIGKSGGKLGRCLTSTKTSDAFIEFMIKGTGKVYQVRVNGSTNTPVAKCLRKVMFAMQFPTFDGVRSKHNFDIAF